MCRAQGRTVPGAGTCSVSRSWEMWTEDMRWNKPCWCDTFHCVFIAKMIMTSDFINSQRILSAPSTSLHPKQPQAKHDQFTCRNPVICLGFLFWLFFFKTTMINLICISAVLNQWITSQGLETWDAIFSWVIQVLISKPGNLPYFPDVLSLVVKKFFWNIFGEKN